MVFKNYSMEEGGYMSNRKKCFLVGGMLILLIVGIVLSLFIGKYAISPRELMGILASQVVDIEPFWNERQEWIFWTIRLPRVFLACLVGAALSEAGAVYQGVFENPMASPDFLGASSGATFGAALAILQGRSAGMITLYAFFFSLLTIVLVYMIGRKTKATRTIGLILAGIMIHALFSAGTSFIKLVADQTNQLPAITYWTMGSLTGAEQENVTFAFIMIVIGTIPLFLFRWKINVLTIGEAEALAMGIHVGRLRLVTILCATLLTAASVSVSGLIGWVGLVVPHMARRIIGNNYRYLLPATVILGALFMLVVDTVARNMFVQEVPIGILTAIIGAPFFLYLITKGGEVC
jgi:iron complex transport system permease protein